MSQVVFITPNIQGRFDDDVLGTLQLVTLLDLQGIDCQILPFFLIGEMTSLDAFIRSAVEKIRAHMPKIVSFYTRSDTYHIMLKMAQRIKELWPDVYIVLGGPQSDITAEETIRQIPYVDYICCGEGETTIVPFFSSLLQNAPDTTVAGLVCRENGAVKKNPRPALLQDLDALPMMNYEFFNFRGKPNVPKTAAFPIDVGRGCPFGCTYCSTKTFWGRKFRLKSPERIVEEIKQIHQRFGICCFSFAHDMFTLNRDAVIKTCRLLQALDFPVQWYCSARLDCLDEELLEIMTAAGLRKIFIGIETGSPRMQKEINKNLDLRKALPICTFLKGKKCKAIASFIYGFPEETEVDIAQTMRLIADLLKLRSVSVQTHLCAFLAETELSRRYASQMTRAEEMPDATGNLFLSDCRDLVDQHPALFPHMLEYKTPLRDKLRYFRLFFHLWQAMQPVYQHLSEKYPRDRLIDMYYDFVAANEDCLEAIMALPNKQRLSALILQDKFPERFRDDDQYALIQEICRYKKAEAAALSGDGAETCEIYHFSPSDLKTATELQDITRCVAVVRRKKGIASVSIVPNS